MGGDTDFVEHLGYVVFQILLHVLRLIDIRLHFSASRQHCRFILISRQPSQLIEYDLFCKRFHDIVAGAQLERLRCQIFTACGCYHDKGCAVLHLRIALDFLHDRYSVHSRHDNIH